MKNLLKYALLGLALTLSISTNAHADRWHWGPPKPPPPPPPPPTKCNTAPEVDPSLAIGGIVLLAGSLIVVRTKHTKR
jgi:hypothetical protein